MSTNPDERGPTVFGLQPDRAPDNGASDDTPASQASERDSPDTVEQHSEEPATGDSDGDGDVDEADDEVTGLLSPVEYLAEICGLHQIVLLGDRPGVAEHLTVLAQALPALHAAGVTTLAWEYTNTRSQDALDALVTATEWNDRNCADLFVDLLGIGFAYREYASVLRAAWQLNRSLGDGQQPLRVVGLGIPSYVEDPALLDGRSAGELELRNWWMGGHYRDVTAFHMANVLTAEVLRTGERALVYLDVQRTATRLVEWVDGLSTATVGRLLHNWMGEGVQRVLFHGSVDDGAAIERVEALVAAAPEKVEQLGIDLELSTLGNVGVTGITGSLDGESSSFRLRDIADGYLYVAPLEQWTRCELIPDLVTPQNFADVEARYRALDPRPEPYTLDELEAVRDEGRELLSARWPTLPTPEEPPTRRGRFRRR